MSNLAGKLIVISMMMVSCSFSSSQRAPQEFMEEDWEDLITGSSVDFRPKPDHRFEVIASDEKLAQLPATIRKDDQMSKLALSRFLEKPEAFDLGVYGKVDGAGRFVAHLWDIPDWDRLYWAQVQVLSKKYACFIRDRIKEGDEMKFICRDKRYVKMWRSRGDDWIEFYARLYDGKGHEINSKKPSSAPKASAFAKSYK